jgi:tRNA A-37 threonylcarbamoyl transferase component Bud32
MSQNALNNQVLRVQKVDIKNILFVKKKETTLFPYIISNNFKNGFVKTEVASPLHGRSIIVNFDSTTKRYIITKGNGLTYFPFGFISTEEFDNSSWGFFSSKDACRDYNCGNYISDLGILTNEMEAVFTVAEQTIRFSNLIKEIQPSILQYSVVCPYRISDIPFLSKKIVSSFINNWKKLFEINYSEIHCKAADILLKNIRVMHENDVLHNAIHSQNYTLSLELLDFELSRTPITPYDNENDELHFKKLQKREIIQSLEIINHIAYHFKENINIKVLQQIMIKNGFENFLYPL